MLEFQNRFEYGEQILGIVRRKRDQTLNTYKCTNRRVNPNKVEMHCRHNATTEYSRDLYRIASNFLM